MRYLTLLNVERMAGIKEINDYKTLFNQLLRLFLTSCTIRGSSISFMGIPWHILPWKFQFYSNEIKALASNLNVIFHHKVRLVSRRFNSAGGYKASP